MSAKSIRANTDVERALDENTLRVLRIAVNSPAHDLLRSLLHGAWYAGYDYGRLCQAEELGALQQLTEWYAGYDYGRLCQAEELVALQQPTERPTLTVDAQLDAAMRQLREAVEGKCI